MPASDELRDRAPTATDTRLYLIEDDPTILHFVQQTLLLRPQWRLLGQAGSLAEARRHALTAEANVFLVDLGLPDGRGEEALRLLARHQPEAELLVFTVFGEESRLVALGPGWLLLLAWTLNYQLYRLWTGVIVLVCLLALIKVMHRARWGMNVNQRLMVVVGLATLVTGLRDFLVVQMGLPGDADIRWMTPGSLLLMFAMGWVLVRRTAQTMEQVARHNAELARKVSEREDELHAVFDRLRVVENQRVLDAERRRLTRDMHDGLGSQLVQTLNLVRSSGAQIDSGAVTAMIHHALEELRMTLDSLEPMEGDLPTILGTLRQRIAPALQAARIELDWQVEEVPAVPALEARGVMHLFRCLQEVFANVVKHAHATRVTVRTWTDGGHVFLSVCDNGAGLGEAPGLAFREGGRGIRNIRLRAVEIGAEVRFLPAKPGTCVRFRFDLMDNPPSAT